MDQIQQFKYNHFNEKEQVKPVAITIKLEQQPNWAELFASCDASWNKSSSSSKETSGNISKSLLI